MYKKVLVAEQIEDGSRLLEALDRHRIKYTGAFWLEMPESDNWRLVIGAPMVDRIGSNAAYTKLHLLLRDMVPPTGLSVSNVSLLSPSSYQYVSLRAQALSVGRLGSGPATGNARRVVFEDAYIYA